MGNILYFIKRTLSFLQFYCVIFSTKKVSVFIFSLIFELLCFVITIFASKCFVFRVCALVLEYLFIWFYFGKIFFSLKKQNFFVFFTINRNFFNLKLEILSFLSGTFIFLCFLYLPFLPFVSNEIFCQNLSFIFFVLVDALFFCFIRTNKGFFLQFVSIFVCLPFGMKFSIFPLFARTITEFLILEKNIIKHVRNK